MELQQIYKKIAYYEFANDQLVAELEEIDRLLRKTGFPSGIESVKQVAWEMLQEGEERNWDEGMCA